MAHEDYWLSGAGRVQEGEAAAADLEGGAGTCKYSSVIVRCPITTSIVSSATNMCGWGNVITDVFGAWRQCYREMRGREKESFTFFLRCTVVVCLKLSIVLDYA